MIDQTEKEKRIYQVSLMLRRKSTSFIVDFIRREWNLERAQAFNYIKDARSEWHKYFAKLKRDGMAYHISQLRELKDQAFGRATIIGKGENKMVVEVPDLNLVFEITKEEAKLMGIYPANKIEGDLNLKHSGEIDSKLTHVLKMEDGELNELINKLSKTGTGDSTPGTEEKKD